MILDDSKRIVVANTLSAWGFGGLNLNY